MATAGVSSSNMSQESFADYKVNYIKSSESSGSITSDILSNSNLYIMDEETGCLELFDEQTKKKYIRQGLNHNLVCTMKSNGYGDSVHQDANEEMSQSSYKSSVLLQALNEIKFARANIGDRTGDRRKVNEIPCQIDGNGGGTATGGAAERMTNGAELKEDNVQMLFEIKNKWRGLESRLDSMRSRCKQRITSYEKKQKKFIHTKIARIRGTLLQLVDGFDEQNRRIDQLILKKNGVIEQITIYQERYSKKEEL